MTKTLETLIDLRQQDIDNLRNDLNVYLDKGEELEKLNEQLSEQLKQEVERAKTNPETQYALTQYAQHVQIQQTNNKRFIEQIEKQAEKIRVKIGEAFGELKKFEILKEKKEEEIAKALAKRENDALDELSLQQFARKESES